MELVAVENLVFAHAWRAAGNAERPTFHGVPYDSMIDDPKTADGRGSHVRAALRSARLDLSRQSERASSRRSILPSPALTTGAYGIITDAHPAHSG